ncbi:hypothetical protein [Actinomadura sp. WMMA1423]|uniref:hypothetical protein n=1 Tax=Actinomadura sp. WMMA1423 TaxID=2591108 RepID=UPI0011466991|nr:hypothetical protein [Actinomadura sp. WMMA1423]
MATTTFRTTTALCAVALTACLGVTASPATATTRESSVTGAGRVFYAPAPDDDVRFTFDAHAVSPADGPAPRPADARGTVRVHHRVAAQGLAVWAEGEVNCVMTSGRAATLTAVITRTSPELGSWMGKHLGFTVFDGGDGSGRNLDQMGSTGPMDSLAKCMAGENSYAPVLAPAPFFTLQSGNYRVKAA